jgi:DNA invertase Pin-like site-specific DNA recombinase
MAVLASVAQYETEIRAERTLAGQAVASELEGDEALPFCQAQPRAAVER